MITPKIVVTGTKLNRVLYSVHCFSYNTLIYHTYLKFLFPDNTSIFSDSDFTDYAIEFIVTFDTIHLPCAMNSVSLNLNKTNYVHFTTKTNTKIDISINF